MNFPEVLKQPPTFVAAALVTACLVALLTAIGGFLLIDGATRTALTVKPVGAGAVSTSVDPGADGADAGGAAKTSAILR